jgi:hypothetical protein
MVRVKILVAGSSIMTYLDEPANTTSATTYKTPKLQSQRNSEHLANALCFNMNASS